MDDERRGNFVDNVNNAASSLYRNILRGRGIFSGIGTVGKVGTLAGPGLGISLFATLGIIVVSTAVIMIVFLGGAGLGAEIPQDTFQTSSQGGVTSTKFNTYFCQGALKWQNNCNLASNGCTPTSTAMILSSFGTNITPPEVAINYFGRAGCDGATSFDNYKSKIASLGFEIAPSIVKQDSLYGGNKLNMKEAETFLKSGYLILAASGPYKCFPSNKCAGKDSIALHEFVIVGVDAANNTVKIRDPNSCSYSSYEDVEDSQYNTRELIYSNFGDFFHAYPIKKI